MSKIEKARALLAAEWRKASDFGVPGRLSTYMVDLLEKGEWDGAADMRAVIAALAPPEGYVPATAILATATRLRRLASAASPLGRKAYIKAAEDIEMTVRAARPEVP